MDRFITASFSIIAFSTFATTDGVYYEKEDWKNLIRIESDGANHCSGLLSGNFVLTAAHCVEGESDKLTFTTSTESISKYKNVYIDESFEDLGDSSIGNDIAIIELSEKADYKSIFYFHDAKEDEFKYKEPVKIFGFGGSGKLSSATMELTDWRNCDSCNKRGDSLNAAQVNESHTTGGDSGGPWLNQNGEVIAVHKGSTAVSQSGKIWRETYSTKISSASDFILDTINGWHYPTNLTVNGKTDITLQSLHKTGSEPDLANAYRVEGDVEIMPSSSCLNGTITSFSVCELSIKSNGGTGKVWLSDDEVMVINKKVKQPTNGDVKEPQSSGSKSGGSVGFGATLFMLFLIGRRYMSSTS